MGAMKNMLLIKRPVDTVIRVYRGQGVTMLYPQVMGHESVNANTRMNITIRNRTMELIRSLIQPDMKTTIDGSFEIKTTREAY